MSFSIQYRVIVYFQDLPIHLSQAEEINCQ